jgi:preprotein translocase subunit SecA
VRVLDKILRAGEGKVLRKLKNLTVQVNALEDDFRALSDEELRALTPQFKQRLEAGETLDDLLPEAFAGPAPLRRADHGRGGASPGQHRGDEDR